MYGAGGPSGAFTRAALISLAIHFGISSSTAHTKREAKRAECYRVGSGAEGKKPLALLETASRPLISKTAMYKEGGYCVEDYDTVRVWMQRFSEHRSTGPYYIVDIDYIEGIKAPLNRVIFSWPLFFKQNKAQ